MATAEVVDFLCHKKVNLSCRLRKDLACAKSLRDAGGSLVILTQDRKNLYFMVMLEKSGPAGTKGEL